MNKKWNDFRLILTSATLDKKKFSKYFNNCSVFEIPGRTFPVEIYFLKNPITDYLETSIQNVIEIHMS